MNITRNINKNIFREYDIRGTYPNEINEDEKNEYLSAVMKLVSIILEDDAYVASIVLYKMLNKGYCKGRSK